MYKIVDCFGSVYGTYSDLRIALGKLNQWGGCMMLVDNTTGEIIAEV